MPIKKVIDSMSSFQFIFSCFCEETELMGAPMQIMTVREVAKFLRLRESTVCSLASKGKLPSVKVGKCWRFDRATLEKLVTGARSKIINGADGGR